MLKIAAVAFAALLTVGCAGQSPLQPQLPASQGFATKSYADDATIQAMRERGSQMLVEVQRNAVTQADTWPIWYDAASGNHELTQRLRELQLRDQGPVARTLSPAAHDLIGIHPDAAVERMNAAVAAATAAAAEAMRSHQSSRGY